MAIEQFTTRFVIVYNWDWSPRASWQCMVLAMTDNVPSWIRNVVTFYIIAPLKRLLAIKDGNDAHNIIFVTFAPVS